VHVQTGLAKRARAPPFADCDMKVPGLDESFCVLVLSLVDTAPVYGPEERLGTVVV